MDNSRPTKSGNLDPLGRYYTGEIAASYDAFRQASKSWQAENAAIERIFESLGLQPGSVVLDVPVGTGRFLPLFAKSGYKVIAVDVSPDMADAARAKAAECGLDDAAVMIDDATALGLPDNSVDAALSVRFLVHLELASVERVLSELARVSRRYVIVHVRIRRPGAVAAFGRWLRHSLGKFRAASGSGEGSARAVKVLGKLATMHRRPDLEACWERCGLALAQDLTVNVTSRGYECHILVLTVQT